MRVFKFGGASVRSIAQINHLADIIKQQDDELVLVVSAMGKTTNRLERVVEAIHPSEQEYDRVYDQIVSNGELWSTRFVADVLRERGVDVHWIDMTRVLMTDDTFRSAVVDFDATRPLLRQAVDGHRICIVQGFIGGTTDGLRTTLGREGSDYTAAIVANLLDADSVTLFKDVDGIMSADPKVDATAHKIDHLTYAECEAMARAGAQVVHPKTMAPLAQKNIPLFVKPFKNPEASGTLING